jgi:AcrR family transcriptional regulator
MVSSPFRIAAPDRKRQILAVATSLFARQGFAGTTTRQIAQQAEVNEALIFRHFLTKEELYWAVLEAKILEAAPAERMQEAMASAEGVAVFENVAHEILERRAKDDTLSRLLMFSGLEKHELAERFFSTYVAAYYERLADHIRHLIRAGTLRDIDPLLAARAFLGMVIYHSWIQEVYGGKEYRDYPIAEISRTLAEIWWGGMKREQIVAFTPPKSHKSKALPRGNRNGSRPEKRTLAGNRS